MGGDAHATTYHDHHDRDRGAKLHGRGFQVGNLKGFAGIQDWEEVCNSLTLSSSHLLALCLMTL